MEKVLSQHISELRQKILLLETACEQEADGNIRAEWHFAIRDLQIALRYYEAACRIEQETVVPMFVTAAASKQS